MTYKEIYKQFLSTSGFNRSQVRTYKPIPEVSFGTKNGIVIYLKDGNRLIYLADVEIKGYAYFKDERKEREVITEYDIVNDDHITFRTKSGEYCYYTSYENVYMHNEQMFTCKFYRFGKIDGTTYNSCDIEMIELVKGQPLIKSVGVHYI